MKREEVLQYHINNYKHLLRNNDNIIFNFVTFKGLEASPVYIFTVKDKGNLFEVNYGDNRVGLLEIQELINMLNNNIGLTLYRFSVDGGKSYQFSDEYFEQL